MGHHRPNNDQKATHDDVGIKLCSSSSNEDLAVSNPWLHGSVEHLLHDRMGET